MMSEVNRMTRRGEERPKDKRDKKQRDDQRSQRERKGDKTRHKDE